jgi:hypothetical protein
VRLGHSRFISTQHSMQHRHTDKHGREIACSLLDSVSDAARVMAVDNFCCLATMIP